MSDTNDPPLDVDIDLDAIDEHAGAIRDAVREAWGDRVALFPRDEQETS